MSMTKEQQEFLLYALKQDSGVAYMKMATCENGEPLCLVISKIDGEFHAKLAFNVDDLQCDYDVDWVMPFAENGDVYDTDTIVSDNINDWEYDWGYWTGEAESIVNLVNQGEISTGK